MREENAFLERKAKHHQEESEKAYKRASDFAMEVEIRNHRIVKMIGDAEELSTQNWDLKEINARLAKSLDMAREELREVHKRLNDMVGTYAASVDTYQEACKTLRDRIEWIQATRDMR